MCYQFSLVAQMVKCLPAICKTQLRCLGREDPLEKGMATHSSGLAWRILWTEEPGGGGCSLWGWQWVRYDWATNSFSFIHDITVLILGPTHVKLDIYIFWWKRKERWLEVGTLYTSIHLSSWSLFVTKSTHTSGVLGAGRLLISPCGWYSSSHVIPSDRDLGSFLCVHLLMWEQVEEQGR